MEINRRKLLKSFVTGLSVAPLGLLLPRRSFFFMRDWRPRDTSFPIVTFDVLENGEWKCVALEGASMCNGLIRARWNWDEGEWYINRLVKAPYDTSRYGQIERVETIYLPESFDASVLPANRYKYFGRARKPKLKYNESNLSPNPIGL